MTTGRINQVTIVGGRGRPNEVLTPVHEATPEGGSSLVNLEGPSGPSRVGRCETADVLASVGGLKRQRSQASTHPAGLSLSSGVSPRVGIRPSICPH
jgi:hypothetical protein